MTATRKQDDETELLDLELDELPGQLRWREWMNRIETVIFASASPVGRISSASMVWTYMNSSITGCH